MKKFQEYLAAVLKKIRIPTPVQAAVFFGGMCIGSVVIFGLVIWNTADNQPEQSQVLAGVVDDTPTVLAFASSTPYKLRIPKISLDTNFSGALGLEDDGSLEVPDSYTEVGWYGYGPTPGAVGPAVVVGHVDSYEGPAVFFNLGQLAVGDDIYIDREDGTVVHFKVERLERPAQSSFPTVQVYGDIDHAGLRLITCSGTYVRGVNRYTHNLIVYARLVTKT